MTQQVPVRIPIFRAGSLPDAASLPDNLIVSVGVADGSRVLLRSDGITWQAVGSLLSDLSSQAQAEAGLDNTTVMTPLRVRQAILAYFGVVGENGYVLGGYVTAGYVSP